jgi:hypothetical protein
MAARKTAKMASKKAVVKGTIFTGVSVDMMVLGAITSCIIVSFIGGVLFGILASSFVH